MPKGEDSHSSDLWDEPCIYVIHDEKETLTHMERIIFLPDRAFTAGFFGKRICECKFRSIG